MGLKIQQVSHTSPVLSQGFRRREMAQRQLELSCARFRKDLSAEDDKAIRTTSLDDVRAAIAQIETELASRQSLRNFDRLSPYINAIERYGKVIEVFCNSDPLVPYIWVIICHCRFIGAYSNLKSYGIRPLSSSSYWCARPFPSNTE